MPDDFAPVTFPDEVDLEPAISLIAERAKALTGASGAAIALRKGDEMVCRARAGRTAPDLGVRLQVRFRDFRRLRAHRPGFALP